MSAPEPETPLVLHCDGAELLGILHRGAADASHGVVVAVGGPQYRVGSHRQFVLLARRLAAEGIPVLRFDCRGMGDSGGEPRSFEAISEDLRAAVDTLLAHRPQLSGVVLWGLCDAASAIAFYAATDPRVSALAILNPWVRTEAGEAKTYLRHYYTARLLSLSFWRKALAGRLNLRRSLGALRGFLRDAHGGSALREESAAAGRAQTGAPLPVRMLAGLAAFGGPVLLILSGRDLTAREFAGLLKSDRGWRRWASRRQLVRHDLPEADHTFSSAQWRGEVERLTLDWLRSHPYR